MIRIARLSVLILGLLIFGTACVNHIKPYEPKSRDYRQSLQEIPMEEPRTEGSIWSERSNHNWLFSDPRASKINDIVVVRIEEKSSADHQAQTKLVKDSEISAQIESLLGTLKTFQDSHPNFDRANLIKSGYAADFDGGGQTTRQGNVIATVPSQIRKELPNGNLFIEGHRVVLVNNEEAHFYVSGVIRPHDIGKDNSISSWLIAEAQIEFTGRGTVSEKTEPGWANRALDYVWPF